jgi:hypothetical protein
MCSEQTEMAFDVCGVDFARASEAQTLRVTIVSAICDASHQATRMISAGTRSAPAVSVPSDPQEVLKSRLATP